MKEYHSLCRPAQFYAILSVISLFGILVQNLTDSTTYCLGSYSCQLEFSKAFIFVGKALYMLFWTIVLQSLCKSGYKSLSWFIVLVPFVLMFVLLGLFMISMQ